MILDDEKEIADLLELYFKNEGYNVFKFYTGKEALLCAENEKIDAAILDVMLPDMDGFYILGKLREKYFFPIVMLTAKISDGDKILGLTIGADDYISKPFNPLEVVARIKTQIRRSKNYNSNLTNDNKDDSNEVEIRGLIMNKNTHKCMLYGEEIFLTPIEFSILFYLCINKGKVVSSEDIFKEVWKENYFDSNNTIMTHIGRIREKIKDDPKKAKFIKTVWGVGYTIEE